MNLRITFKPSAIRGKPSTVRFLMRVFVMFACCVAGLGSAHAQDRVLNAKVSHLYMQTAKANCHVETNQFTALEGSISKDGNAKIKIDLASISSGIDVRDVRMRFLLFETFKFPTADVTAKLDMGKLQELRTSTRIVYPLKFTLSLHGITRDIEALVFVTRLDDK